MQHVSDDWKAIHRQQLLNETFVEISFDIADPDALNDVTSEDNGAMYISNTAQTVSVVDKDIVPYGTLEENLWLLDGSRRFIPDSEFGDNGFIGNTLSGADGSFNKTPIITLRFSEAHQPIIPGITITWGVAYGEYAEEFKVVAYNGSTIVADKYVRGNTSVKSVVMMDIENYDCIRIEILKWCLAYHRPRVSEIFVGINKVYTKNELTGYEHTQEVSPIGATTPMNKMGFSIDNTDNQFDPNNVNGFSKYLMERQELRVRYGMKLNDDSIEYIPAGVFYLSEWDAPQNGIEATFNARDLLEFMRSVYTKGQFHANGVSLYDLAIGVLDEADLPLNDDGSVKWVIDESLKSIYTVAPLPMVSIAECLQYIAQAACCVIYCDRAGVIHIEPIANEQSDYELTSFNMFARPEISLQKPLRAVSTKVYNYIIGETTEELFNGTVSIVGSKDVVITYANPAVDVQATVVGGTLVSAAYYSNACYLTISGEGDVTITITGNTLKTSQVDYVIDGEESGEVQAVDNPLISSNTMAANVGEWVKGWLMSRQIMEIGSWRADPRLDVMDIISAENKYSRDNVRVTAIKYAYAGAFRGTGEGRVM